MQGLPSGSAPVERESHTLTVVAPLSVQEVLGQVQLVQQVMSLAMKDGEHFGTIPGCGKKPTLLKPGAEKLCLTFRLAPRYEVEERLLERLHREYRVTATLESIGSKVFIGQGLGSCSTMEAKYRYRGASLEVTERPVPKAYWDVRGEDAAKAQELIGGRGYAPKKVEGQGWMIARVGEKSENPDLADQYNTVLKMAKKRALVDAVLTATAASDIFTQDLEDITANLAVAGETSPSGPTAGGPSERVLSPVHSGADASRGAQGRTLAAAEPATAELVDDTRIHFGKNRGKLLSELTFQQVHWYETDWMPKKEKKGSVSPEDEGLIRALKERRAIRNQQKLVRVRADIAAPGISEKALVDYLREQASTVGRAVNQLEDLTADELDKLIKGIHRVVDAITEREEGAGR